MIINSRGRKLTKLRKLTLNDGKYTIQWSNDFKVYECLRYNEPWRDLTGDNLILALIQEINDLQEAIRKRDYDQIKQPRIPTGKTKMMNTIIDLSKKLKELNKYCSHTAECDVKHTYNNIGRIEGCICGLNKVRE